MRAAGSSAGRQSPEIPSRHPFLGHGHRHLPPSDAATAVTSSFRVRVDTLSACSLSASWPAGVTAGGGLFSTGHGTRDNFVNVQTCR